MNILDLLNTDAKHLKDMFGIEQKRWMEIIEGSMAASYLFENVTSSITFVKKHLNLADEKEELGAFFVIAKHAGVADGRAFAASQGKANATLQVMEELSDAKSWLRKRNIPLTKEFIEIENSVAKAISDELVNDVFSKKSDESKKEDDEDHPMSNKNKFKSGDFDIPQP